MSDGKKPKRPAPWAAIEARKRKCKERADVDEPAGLPLPPLMTARVTRSQPGSQPKKSARNQRAQFCGKYTPLYGVGKSVAEAQDDVDETHHRLVRDSAAAVADALSKNYNYNNPPPEVEAAFILQAIKASSDHDPYHPVRQESRVKETAHNTEQDRRVAPVLELKANKSAPMTKDYASRKTEFKDLKARQSRGLSKKLPFVNEVVDAGRHGNYLRLSSEYSRIEREYNDVKSNGWRPRKRLNASTRPESHTFAAAEALTGLRSHSVTTPQDWSTQRADFRSMLAEVERDRNKHPTTQTHPDLAPPKLAQEPARRRKERGPGAPASAGQLPKRVEAAKPAEGGERKRGPVLILRPPKKPEGYTTRGVAAAPKLSKAALLEAQRAELSMDPDDYSSPEDSGSSDSEETVADEPHVQDQHRARLSALERLQGSTGSEKGKQLREETVAEGQSADGEQTTSPSASMSIDETSRYWERVAAGAMQQSGSIAGGQETARHRSDSEMLDHLDEVFKMLERYERK